MKKWLNEEIPVVLILWDVRQVTGFWLDVDSAAEELGNRQSGWRQQKTARIRFPRNKRLDGTGLIEIRRYVADRFFPLHLSEQLDLRVRLEFPNTPEGRSTYEGFQRFRETGDPVVIPGESVTQMKFSDWFTRLYGEDQPVAELEMGSGPGKEPVPFRLDFVASNGQRIGFDYLEFFLIKAGLSQIVIANKLQPIAWRFEIKVRKTGGSMSLDVRPGTNVLETLDVIAKMRVLEAGGKGFLNALGKDSPPIEFLIHPISFDVRTDPAYTVLIEKAAHIQERTGAVLALGDDWILSQEDVDAIVTVDTVIETGELLQEYPTQYVRSTREGILRLLRQSETPDFRRVKLQDVEFVEVKVLGKDVPLGPCTVYLSGTLVSPRPKEVELGQTDEEDELTVQFENVEITAKVYELVARHPMARRTDTAPEMADLYIIELESSTAQPRELA